MAKGSTNFGPVDLSSDVPQQWYLVSKGSINLGPDDLSSDVPPVETSSDHEQ